MLESFLLRLLSHPVLGLDLKLIAFLAPDPPSAEEVEEEVIARGETNPDEPRPTKAQNADQRDIAEYLLELAGFGKDKYKDLPRMDKYHLAPDWD